MVENLFSHPRTSQGQSRWKPYDYLFILAPPAERGCACKPACAESYSGMLTFNIYCICKVFVFAVHGYIKGLRTTLPAPFPLFHLKSMRCLNSQFQIFHPVINPAFFLWLSQLRSSSTSCSSVWNIWQRTDGVFLLVRMIYGS